MTVDNPIFGRHIGDHASASTAVVQPVAPTQLQPSKVDVVVGGETDPSSQLMSGFQNSVTGQLSEMYVRIKVYRFGGKKPSLDPDSVKLKFEAVVERYKKVPGYDSNHILPGIVQAAPEVLILMTASHSVYVLQAPQGAVFFKEKEDKYLLLPKG
jgi:hypothetical protein